MTKYRFSDANMRRSDLPAAKSKTEAEPTVSISGTNLLIMRPAFRAMCGSADKTAMMVKFVEDTARRSIGMKVLDGATLPETACKNVRILKMYNGRDGKPSFAMVGIAPLLRRLPACPKKAGKLPLSKTKDDIFGNVWHFEVPKSPVMRTDATRDGGKLSTSASDGSGV